MSNEILPLAFRVRPDSPIDYQGQAHLMSQGSVLERILSSKKLTSSLILYGPPGSGKSTLASIIVNVMGLKSVQLNAINSNVAELRAVIASAQQEEVQTVVLIDEIHRFNKTQQDSLLKAVEEGTISIIGTTTENPFFAINNALLSRSTILNLQPLSNNDISAVIDRALKLEYPQAEVTPELIEQISAYANGDARRALNIVETLLLDKIRPTLEDLLSLGESSFLSFDKTGTQHYDLTSAFIKSIRGSDVDASILYLVTALQSGMEPLYLARRLVILASEDIGLTDPSALTAALNAFRAVEVLGLPECQYALVQATTHLALAYKSNSLTQALTRAQAIVRKNPISPPVAIRDGHYAGSKALGVSGYLYPHDYPGAVVAQQYWPEDLRKSTLYEPSGRGAEGKVKELLALIKARLLNK